jgi:hypothetical protein
MLLLTSTSDKIQVVTGAAASIKCRADWSDNASGTISYGRTNTAAISTATTTDIVASPASSTARNVRNINIRNDHASTACQVTVQHTDGTTTTPEFAVNLLAGEVVTMLDTGEWIHYDVNGAPYSYQVPAPGNLGATGTLGETLPRELCPEVNTTVGASGTLFMQAIYLTAGQTLNTIDLWSATTAAGTPTNYNVGIFDSSRNLVAQSTNKTTTAWAANSISSFTLTAAYRVPTSGLYYIGFYMTATTVVTLKGGTAKTGGQLAAAAPILNGTSSTGLTTTLPNPAAAITAGTASIYAAVR